MAVMTAGSRVVVSVADLAKVGPHGYIHGWIKVGTVAPEDLSLDAKTGDIVHTASGTVIAHTRSLPNMKRSTTQRVGLSMESSTSHWNGPRDSVIAAAAYHHNRAIEMRNAGTPLPLPEAKTVKPAAPEVPAAPRKAPASPVAAPPKPSSATPATPATPSAVAPHLDAMTPEETRHPGRFTGSADRLEDPPAHLDRRPSPLYHGSRRAIAPGTILDSEHGARFGLSQEGYSYASYSPEDAMNYATRPPKYKKLTGEPHFYHVEPVGPYGPDPANTGQSVRSEAGFRVIREILIAEAKTLPEPGTLLNNSFNYPLTHYPSYIGADDEYREDEDAVDRAWYGGQAPAADVTKVGPHGYIHGWIKVGPGEDIDHSKITSSHLAKPAHDIISSLKAHPITPIPADDYGPAQGYDAVPMINEAVKRGEAGDYDGMMTRLAAARDSLARDDLSTDADRLTRMITRASRVARYRSGQAEPVTSLNRDDFTVLGDNIRTHSKSYEQTITNVAAHLNASDEDLRALANEDGRHDTDTLSGDELKRTMVEGYINDWRGSSGGPAQVAMITHVADRLGRPYELADNEKRTNAYIAARPAVQRAAHAIGDAMYDTTQEWLKDNGIQNLELHRASRGADWDKTRPFTSWSTMPGWTREGNTGGTRHEVIPAERIFSLPPTGFGTYQESEAVVLPALPGEASRVVKGVQKNAADLHDPSPVDGEHVYQQLLANYPPHAISWVKEMPWIGPINVPLDSIDWDAKKSWAASHQEKRVKKFQKRIRGAGKDVNPVILVQVPGNDKRVIVDGHHRALAYEKEGKPVKAYIGTASSDNADSPWFKAHDFQYSSGSKTANKSARFTGNATVKCDILMPVAVVSPESGVSKAARFPTIWELANGIEVPGLEKAGKEGYIHGWICVNPPCGHVGDKVTHADHGDGTIRGKNSDGTLIARFSDGTYGRLGDQMPVSRTEKVPVQSLASDHAADSGASLAVFSHRGNQVTRSDEVPAAWNRLTTAEQQRLQHIEIHVDEGANIHSAISNLGINVSNSHEGYGIATGLTHEGKTLVTRSGVANGDLDHELGHALDDISRLDNGGSRSWEYNHADAAVRKETRGNPQLNPHFDQKQNKGAAKERFAELFSQHRRGIRRYDLGVKLSPQTSRLVTDFFDRYRDGAVAKQHALESVSFAEKTASGKIKISLADLVKVGPEGYIHGYICVRPPCGPQYTEAKFNSGKGTVEHEGASIGKMRKNADGTYSMSHIDQGGRQKLDAKYTTRSDAAKSIALYHNMWALQNSARGVSPEDAAISHDMARAITAMRTGDHESAASGLETAASDADKTGNRTFSTHARELAAAVRDAPKAVIDAPAPTPESVPDAPFDSAPHIAAMREILASLPYEDDDIFRLGHVDTQLQNAIDAAENGWLDSAARGYDWAEEAARYVGHDDIGDRIHAAGDKFKADRAAYEARMVAAMPPGWEKDLLTDPVYLKPENGFQVQAMDKNGAPLSLHPTAERGTVPKYFATQREVDDFIRDNSVAYSFDPFWREHGRKKPTIKTKAATYTTSRVIDGKVSFRGSQSREPGEVTNYGDNAGDAIERMPIRFAPRKLPPGADRWAHQPDPEPSDEQVLHQHIATEVRSQLRRQDALVPSVVRNTQVTVTKAPQTKYRGKPKNTLGDFIADYPNPPYHGNIRVVPDVFSALNAAEARKVLRDNLKVNWWVPVDANYTLADHIIAHETGHGVAAKAFGKADVPQDGAFWSKFAHAVGGERQMFPGAYSEDVIAKWMKTYQFTLEKAVSRYGASMPSEMLAELWAEYTLNSHPRPPAQVYGDYVMAVIKAQEEAA